MPDRSSLNLPLSIAQPVDVALVLHELNIIDEHLNQVAIKSPDKQIHVKTSAKLTELISLNNIELTNEAERTRIIKYLNELHLNAPTINISFGSEASEPFIQKITQWFREQVDPESLIIIGLEPSIGIGSIVRTTNKVFDFSLKNQLKSTRNQLLDRIKQLNIAESQ